ncbi:P-loop NTPase family protein [Streptoalloteichus hindustanus]|uniref:50S ribosome-binding GTPase n=1 Tax=Streptoalloteichus hindustanus TaxID=2017 RepID=A0A1M5Q6T4_STRHI|nr:hypothetical protein [Streptoalloteichus hindustanus]SHH09610.1 hypothetical protein SAMN05444320_1229 [Streptoalloteichus hindustanus]
MSTDLATAVRALFGGAFSVYRDNPRAGRWLQDHLRRLDEPLRIAVVGPPGSGKSTVVSAVTGRGLRDATLVERSLSEAAGEGGGVGLSDVDAALHLTRHPDEGDLRLLRSTQDSPVASALPANAVVVLSRADETNAGRIDALTTARQIARRHRTDVRLRAVCANVVALSGLLAHAGRTLREPEFADLAALAAVPRPDLEGFLLSVDRFAGAAVPVLGQRERHALLDRFGLFGVRLTVTLIRTGCDTRTKLSTQLVRRSGLAELRETVTRCLTDRHHVLKARSALLALDLVLRREPRPTAGRLAADLERLLVSTHDFRELRALAALTSGRTTLPGDLATEAERLLGGQGLDPAARLGTPDELPDRELHSATTDALLRWQVQTENPLLDQHQRDLARTVVRTCEGLLTQLPG